MTRHMSTCCQQYTFNLYLIASLKGYITCSRKRSCKVGRGLTCSQPGMVWVAGNFRRTSRTTCGNLFTSLRDTGIVSSRHHLNREAPAVSAVLLGMTSKPPPLPSFINFEIKVDSKGISRCISCKVESSADHIVLDSMT